MPSICSSSSRRTCLPAGLPCRQLRLEEAKIQQEKAIKTQKMTNALSKDLFMDGLVLEEAYPVREMDAEVASLLEQLNRLEAAQEDEDKLRKMKRRYIEAVQELRRRRAPHLYGGGEFMTTAPATPISEQSGEEAKAATDIQRMWRGRSSGSASGALGEEDLGVDELQGEDEELEEIQS